MVILDPPGVGKSHLAVGLGLKAIGCGYRVLFTTAAAMIGAFSKALSEAVWAKSSSTTRCRPC